MWAYEAEELLAMMKITQNSDIIHPQPYDLSGRDRWRTCWHVRRQYCRDLGHRVVLVEKEAQIGGAGINSGTAPSKTLRETALALSGWHSRKLFGVDLSLRREATIADFTHHQDNVTAGERRSIQSRLERNGVDSFQGAAHFVNPHTIRISRGDGSEVHLSGEKILVATFIGKSVRRVATYLIPVRCV